MNHLVYTQEELNGIMAVLRSAKEKLPAEYYHRLLAEVNQWPGMAHLGQFRVMQEHRGLQFVYAYPAPKLNAYHSLATTHIEAVGGCLLRVKDDDMEEAVAAYGCEGNGDTVEDIVEAWREQLPK